MQVILPKLESLELNELNCPKIWNSELPSSRLDFQSLTNLIVRSCENLKGLIPLFGARNLVNLKTLRVSNCKAMEEVVVTEEYSAQDSKTSSIGNKISFPKLEELQLNWLPNLERFCAGDFVDCPSLIKLEISSSQKVEAFITKYMPRTEDKNDVSKNYEHKQCLFDHNKVTCFSLDSFD